MTCKDSANGGQYKTNLFFLADAGHKLMKMPGTHGCRSTACLFNVGSAGSVLRKLQILFLLPGDISRILCTFARINMKTEET